MENLSNIIADYLGKPTDYAVQIVGNFGHGKTYYYNSVLEKLISNTPTFEDNSKKYKPIYISLFGLKSTEEVASKIVLSFYQSSIFEKYFKTKFLKKRLKFTGRILKIAVRGFLSYNRLGSVNEYLSDLKQAAVDVLDTKELLVCFDDLERKDSGLSIHDLAGYINSLVDEGVKVLLIANDDLLLKTEKEYSDLKEKIIGISVEYVPDVFGTLKNIIKGKYSQYPVYHTYLLARISLIAQFSDSVQYNFRHVIYALEKFHLCFSKIKAEILDPKHEISEKLQEQLNAIMQLVFSFAAEYKASQLKFSDQAQFEHRASLSHKILLAKSSEIDQKEKSRLQLFLDKYGIGAENYFFYESLYAYITGHDEFNIEEFVHEFIRNFNLNRGKIMEQYEILHSLAPNNFFRLSDADYRTNTMTMIEYARKGMYGAADFLSVMYYSERMDNILELDLPQVEKDLEEGLVKSLPNAGLNSGMTFSQFEASGANDALSPLNKKLYETGIREIRNFRENGEQERQHDLSMLLISDFENFVEKHVNDRQFRSTISFMPILNRIGAENLINFLKAADQNKITFLIDFCLERYQDLNMLISEYDTLTVLTNLLQEYYDQEIEKCGKTIRNYLLGNLLQNFSDLRLKHLALIASA
jgi:Cdc6-like AAA superfamily ATPase